mgnify:CR=1 FL=1
MNDMSFEKAGGPHSSEEAEQKSIQEMSMDELWASMDGKITKLIKSLLIRYQGIIDKRHAGLQVEDVKNEAFEKLHECYKERGDKKNFLAYFCEVIKNNFIDKYLRSATRLDNFIKSSDREAISFGQNGNNPESDSIFRERQEQLKTIIESSSELSIAEKLIVVLRFGLGEFWLKELKFQAQNSAEKFGRSDTSEIFQTLDNYRSVDWGSGLSIGDIAVLFKVNTSTIYRAWNKAKEILQKKLKDFE